MDLQLSFTNSNLLLAIVPHVVLLCKIASILSTLVKSTGVILAHKPY